MYNRYIGNTGRFIRVEEPGDNLIEQIRPHIPEPHYEHPERSARQETPVSSAIPLLTNGILPGILPGGLAGGIKGALKGILPDKIDIGDLLLILVLLLLYLENEDEEILIILGALIFMGFK